MGYCNIGKYVVFLRENDYKIPPTDYMVLIEIVRMTCGQRSLMTEWFSIVELSKAIKLDVRTSSNCVRHLINNNFIRKVGTNGGMIRLAINHNLLNFPTMDLE